MTVKSMARDTLFTNSRVKHPIVRTFAADATKALATLLDGNPRKGYASHLARREAAQRSTTGLTLSCGRFW